MAVTENIETLARPDHSAYEREDLWNEIIPGLWQGGTADHDTVHTSRKQRRDAAYIQPQDFDTVITLYAWAQPVDWFVKEMRFGFWDAGVESMPIVEVFEVARLAYEEWSNDRKVLIRCQAGLNRSGLITALVMMMAGYSADEAISLIREKRSRHALCNPEFEAWLRKMPSDTLAEMVA
jgi:protein tyrosine phosphatase